MFKQRDKRKMRKNVLKTKKERNSERWQDGSQLVMISSLNTVISEHIIPFSMSERERETETERDKERFAFSPMLSLFVLIKLYIGVK